MGSLCIIYHPGELRHQRLRKEIEIWKRLDHKNIVPLLGTTSEFGSDCSTGMVSPWMNKGNLTTYQERPLTPSQCLQLVSVTQLHIV